MSYIAATHAADAAQLSSFVARPVAPKAPVSLLAFANKRLSEALEAAILVATLSGVSLVMSTIAAGAF